MTNNENSRLSIWLIDNVTFSGNEFLKLENSWTDEQWKAIQSQRNLLIEIVIKSLVNYIKNIA